MRRPLALMGLLAAASCLPYIVALALTPSGHSFLGFVYLADDNATYLAKILEGYHGDWLWHDVYTLTPYPGILLYTWYMAAGHLGALLHLPPVLAWQGLRLAGALTLGAALVAAAWRWASPGAERWGALLLAALGSGLGWLTFVLYAAHLLPWPPFDVAGPETSAFYSMLAVPHFALGAALALAVLLALHRRAGLRAAGLGAAAAWALAPLHPQALVVLGAALAVDVAWRGLAGERVRGEALTLCAWIVLCAPPLSYYAYEALNSPLIHDWSASWYQSSPDPINYLLSLGALGPLTVWGAVLVVRRRRADLYLLLAWSAVSFLLLYLPGPFSALRRSLDGVYMAHAVLSAIALADLWARWRSRTRALLRPLAIPVFGLTTALVFALPLGQAVARPFGLYVAASDMDVLAYLRAHGNLTTLSGSQTGLLIPAVSGNATWVGHFAETIDYRRRRSEMDAYLRSPDARQRSAFALSTGAAVLVIGTAERARLSWDPAQEPYLRVIYTSGESAVYAIERPRSAAPSP